MNYSLLNRKTIFPDLIEEIGKAQKTIVFDAYIWINDRVGVSVIEACLKAADRGVKIFIRHDLSAAIFEHTPGRLPMFFDSNLLKPKSGKFFDVEYGFLTQKTLDSIAYFIYGRKPRPVLKEKNPLVEKIEHHKNIFLLNTPLFNHGKLILIDEMAYVGGQCISNDYEEWIDYNIKIKDPIVVKNIWKQILSNYDTLKPSDTKFIDNKIPASGSDKKESIHYFIKTFIETCPDELIIEMCYLGKWYVPILKMALKRGAKITLLVTKDNSDTNHHTNMWVLSDLLKLKSKNLTILFSKQGMIHAKGLATKEKITLGAANFHNACGYFFGLNEQNIFSTNKELVEEVFSQFQKDCLNMEMVISKSQLPKWSRLKAMNEIFFVYVSSYITFIYKKRIVKWRSEANKILVDNAVLGF